MAVGNRDGGARSHHAVVELRVTGGFLDGVKLEFANGLNCLIGGRGTGKTTALEFLRYALALESRARSLDGLLKANLGAGRIVTELRTKTGMTYTATRRANGQTVVTDEAGAAVPVTLDRDQIFTADIFSQHEIEDIASNPGAQLRLIDRFVEVEIVAIANDLKQLAHQVDQTSMELRLLDTEIENLVASASEVPALSEKLKGMAASAGPDAAKTNATHTAHTARGREAQVVDRLGAAIEKVSTGWRSTTSAFEAAQETELAPAGRSGENEAIFLALDADVRAYGDALVAMTGALETATTRVASALARHRLALAEVHAAQNAAFEAFVTESAALGGQANERVAVQTSLNKATEAAKDKEAKERQRATVIARRVELSSRISELRDARFVLRKRVAEGLSRDLSNIRVTVQQGADCQAYRELVANGLKGQGMKANMVAERLTEALLPTELAHIVMTRDAEQLAQKLNGDDDRARRIVDALRADGLAYDIETVDVDDVPRIELLDGGIYKESQNLSTGQRCTTILPILLVQSERPLIVDQPEDNLDNAFIYETIVKALRQVTAKRQVIFVTHNPNIPVLGNAERMFVLQSDGKHASVLRSGTVDECKSDIETILEGGHEAFMQRMERYGH
ncbi:MAG TPA: AAA family ATPase [Kofleriaceae bacterium]|jgi:energy-coupling factor transporter ATP-binding protein EcfA2